MNYGLSFGEGVLRTEILVEIDGYLVRGKFTAPLARMRRGGKHDLVLVASDFKAAPGDFHRQPAGAVGVTGTSAATCRKSRPSWRVLFATLRITRS